MLLWSTNNISIAGFPSISFRTCLPSLFRLIFRYSTYGSPRFAHCSKVTIRKSFQIEKYYVLSIIFSYFYWHLDIWLAFWRFFLKMDGFSTWSDRNQFVKPENSSQNSRELGVYVFCFKKKSTLKNAYKAQTLFLMIAVYRSFMRKFPCEMFHPARYREGGHSELVILMDLCRQTLCAAVSKNPFITIEACIILSFLMLYRLSFQRC